MPTNNLSLELKSSNRRTEEEESDRMISLFMKKWKELDLVKQIREKQVYEKPSAKKHRTKRKNVHLREIKEKVVLGKLKPRNKKLHQQILNDYREGKITVRKNKK